MLDLVKIITDNMKYLEDSYILICINNKKVNKNSYVKIEKASMYSSNSGLIFSKIKESMKETNIVIDFKLLINKEKISFNM